MIVLVDMDGVIADFNRGLYEGVKRVGINPIPLDDITTFMLKKAILKIIGQGFRSVYLAPNFISFLPPIPGGLEALCELDKKHKVFICTSPLSDTLQYCTLEKYQWVDKHLGTSWLKRVIIAKDKTIVGGDILIDDKPEIKGEAAPNWEHVIFDAPYNRHITDKKRISWNSWREAVEL